LTYEITFAASAKRELRDLTPDIIARILPKIRDLADQPRPPGCKKLHGSRDRWRIRIGNYRVIYAINDAAKVIDVTRIAHRREVYE
jgi:mRNA interferase RelE/StbE